MYAASYAEMVKVSLILKLRNIEINGNSCQMTKCSKMKWSELKWHHSDLLDILFKEVSETSKEHPDVVNFILTLMLTWHMGSSKWYISDLHLVTIWMYVVVSLPRIGQVAASSQQKEYMPNSTVMWSLGIECKMNPDQLPKFGQWPTSPAYLCIVSTQIRRVTVGTFYRGFIL